jgi:hypothetical protein
MRKELKNTIYETGSKLRNLFANLKNIDSKSMKISELETLVATTPSNFLRFGGNMQQRHPTALMLELTTERTYFYN